MTSVCNATILTGWHRDYRFHSCQRTQWRRLYMGWALVLKIGIEDAGTRSSPTRTLTSWRDITRSNCHKRRQLSHRDKFQGPSTENFVAQSFTLIELGLFLLIKEDMHLGIVAAFVVLDVEVGVLFATTVLLNRWVEKLEAITPTINRRSSSFRKRRRSGNETSDFHIQRLGYDCWRYSTSGLRQRLSSELLSQ
ncbi:hypothetical protein CPB85DRAFT_233229 [Mucidula mucida]|nr:hypothetical protein CPB85DRAFT_233229 [Mucidula mucida]